MPYWVGQRRLIEKVNETYPLEVGKPTGGLDVFHLFCLGEPAVLLLWVENTASSSPIVGQNVLVRHP